jgi:hypothetical protein
MIATLKRRLCRLEAAQANGDDEGPPRVAYYMPCKQPLPGSGDDYRQNRGPGVYPIPGSRNVVVYYIPGGAFDPDVRAAEGAS